MKKLISEERPPVEKEITVTFAKSGKCVTGVIGAHDHTSLDAYSGVYNLSPLDGWELVHTPTSAPLFVAPRQSTRYNQGKPKLSYFARSFPKAVESVARIKEFGATKYEEDNWRNGGKPDTEYLDSHDRHMAAFYRGEFYDQDSGCAHLGHAIWNLCALFELNYGSKPVIEEKQFWAQMKHWAEKKLTNTQP